MSLIPERLAYLPDDDRQDRFTHRGLGPDCLQEGLFRHELTGLHQQTAQDGKSFGADPYRLATLPKALISKIQEKWLEDETLMITHISITCGRHMRHAFETHGTRFRILLEKFYNHFMTGHSR
jgi:hypothetical protein